MPIWFQGTCDSLLVKLAIWHKTYEKGDIHSTREWMDFDGSVKDVVTKRIHRIPFSMLELENLYRILNESEGGAELAKEILNFKDNRWRKGTLMKGGQRVCELAFFPEHVEQMTKIVLACKNAPKLAEFQKTLDEAASGEGKDLFEE